jgi:trimethylamine---corrinoid protein Co-methyltransferase
MAMKDKPDSVSSAPGRLLRFSVVGHADVERIHELSLLILAETGILLYYPPARQLVADHGAAVDEARQVVRIPRRLVEQALAAAPRDVTVYSQSDPRHDYRLYLDGRRYARTTTGLNWILDARASHRRPVTEADVVNWTRVIHAMPNIHFAGSLNDQEEAAKSEEIRCLARMLHYTDKPFMFSTFSGEGMRWLWRLTEIVQPRDRLPRLMVLSSVNSPLVYG